MKFLSNINLTQGKTKFTELLYAFQINKDVDLSMKDKEKNPSLSHIKITTTFVILKESKHKFNTMQTKFIVQLYAFKINNGVNLAMKNKDSVR